MDETTYTALSSDRNQIISLLASTGDLRKSLFEHAARVKREHVGDLVYFRGLIEFSNNCRKNCLYCGIRSGNRKVKRFNLFDEEIVSAAIFANDNGYGSIVLQSGEIHGKMFTKRIESLLKKIHAATNDRLRITLSCGEQEKDVYRRWFESGAKRYLMRIETSNQDLYARLHPNDQRHSFRKRLDCLNILKETGYQTGTGVMIGLPFQTPEDLADDLLFLKNNDIVMIGMGPYLEHADTPLYRYRSQLLPVNERFDLTLKMIAILRIMMKDVNIAATTALQTIDKLGREKAIMAGANVIMPNITPGMYRNDYSLYDNKPCTDENPEDCRTCLEARIALTGNNIAFGEWGDSAHFPGL
ncbi:MAG TPA: [FeFe] hydrogenase H-cluster radical SAM maturase HydE [Bacteroidales bacterium]|nr:[FeFe] hydrogenase H-cluster radical SAM maturase HydE [Bacteroidales bacterium]HPS98016.1 [FeFe] hydrogenase H-cluster radical SAM maturase HydE [Bacteroidales bacterium]